jgi:glycosyltransferase involved in cell wall biosynthesis
VLPTRRPAHIGCRGDVTATPAPSHVARSDKLRVAYLNSEYPSLSHTFIEREIRSVRAHGVDVRTFSIRRPGRTGTLGAAHREAAAETEYVLDGAWRVASTILGSALRHPVAFVRVIAAGQRFAPAGLRSRLLHAAYAAESVRLAAMLETQNLRHIHVHMANNGAAVAMLACRFDPRLRYSLSIHGSAEFFDVHRLRVGAKAEGAVFVRCISAFCKAQVMAWSDPSAWKRFHIVHTGVDETLVKPPASRSQDALRILTVGRMVPIKGYDVLLDACRAMSDAGVPWSLCLVGDGPMRQALERRATELRIADRVQFAGPVPQEEIGHHLDRANVMVVSSFMEGVPVVLMEAMASGLAAVATRVGGVGELIDDGRNGLLVDPGSAQSLAAALLRLAKDGDLRATLGRAARETVCAHWRVDAAGAEMARLFREYFDPENAGAPTAGERATRTDGD